MAIWVVRHGETEWSVSGKHTSVTDVALTEKGREGAVALGKMLAGAAFAEVLVSPRSRAMETCRLAGFGERAIVEPNLQEWNYGESEGKTTAEMRAVRGKDWSVWTSEIVGGETIDAVGVRADAVIARALEVDGDVLCFAHAHILRILAARWVGMEARGGARFALGTACVGVLGFEREVRVVERWNLAAVPNG